MVATGTTTIVYDASWLSKAEFGCHGQPLILSPKNSFAALCSTFFNQDSHKFWIFGTFHPIFLQ